MSDARVVYVEVALPPGKRRAVESAFRWCVEDLGLRPRPVLRVVARVSSAEAVAFRAAGRFVHETVPIRGFVLLSSPSVAFVASEADLETVAHEVRHVWQVRRWGELVFHSKLIEDVEMDARVYAADAIKRFREAVRLGAVA